MDIVNLDKLVGKAVEVEFVDVDEGTEYYENGVIYGYSLRDRDLYLTVVMDDGRINSAIDIDGVRVLHCGVGA